MAIPTKAEREKAMEEARLCAKAEDYALLALAIFVVVGIVSDVLNVPLGLEATNWFLLAVAAMLAAVFFRLGHLTHWYMASIK